MSVISSLMKYASMAVSQGYVYGNMGNISAKDGDGFWITRTGVLLGDTKEDDFIFVPLEGDIPEGASMEAPVHREIYRNTSAGAVLHAHIPFGVIMSLLNENRGGERALIPVDSETKILLKEIPIIDGEVGSELTGKAIASRLSGIPGVVIVSGHGSFAAGRDVKEAFVYTAIAEHSAKVRYYYDMKVRS